MRRGISTLIGLALIVGAAFLVARFFNENNEPIQLQFWVWRTKEIAKGTLIGLVFLGGLMVSAILTASTVVSKSFEVSRLRREVVALQKMLQSKSNPNA